jgi:hypothetical protein
MKPGTMTAQEINSLSNEQIKKMRELFGSELFVVKTDNAMLDYNEKKKQGCREILISPIKKFFIESIFVSSISFIKRPNDIAICFNDDPELTFGRNEDLTKATNDNVLNAIEESKNKDCCKMIFSEPEKLLTLVNSYNKGEEATINAAIKSLTEQLETLNQINKLNRDICDNFISRVNE